MKIPFVYWHGLTTAAICVLAFGCATMPLQAQDSDNLQQVFAADDQAWGRGRSDDPQVRQRAMQDDYARWRGRLDGDQERMARDRGELSRSEDVKRKADADARRTIAQTTAASRAIKQKTDADNATYAAPAMPIPFLITNQITYVIQPATAPAPERGGSIWPFTIASLAAVALYRVKGLWAEILKLILHVWSLGHALSEFIERLILPNRPSDAPPLAQKYAWLLPFTLAAAGLVLLAALAAMAAGYSSHTFAFSFGAMGSALSARSASGLLP